VEGGEGDPRDTEAALDPGGVEECLLKGMEGAVLAGESVDGGDLMAFDRGGEHQARGHGPPVDQHRAGTAVAVGTAVLHRGVTVIAQGLEKGVPGADLQHSFAPVYGHRDSHVASNRAAAASRVRLTRTLTSWVRYSPLT